MNILQKFPRTFWVANIIELFERWAWYGFFMLFANYLTGSELEFSQSQKGLLMGVGTGILYFLPVLTGAIADKYGYKKILLLSFVVYASAFIAMPHFSSFAGVFAVYIYLAIGAALFKPIISATIAKTTTDETASIGFGIFYMMINIGAFFGPMVTLLFKGDSSMIFYISAAIISVNFIMLLFYTEPGEREAPTGSLLKTFGEVFRNMAEIIKDWKFMLFLLIIAGFWTMYNQLFYTLPVFITQWVDTTSLYNFFSQYLPFFAKNYSPAPGVVDSEFITNLGALYIFAFQIIVSSIVMRMKPLRSMMSGFLVCAIGMSLTLMFQNVLFTMVALLIFALGEMAGSPKITEYIGRIAPSDKKAVYMGYSFIPVFLGNIFAGVISGPVYQSMSDKVTFTKRFAAENGLSVDPNLSNVDYFEQVAHQMNMTTTQLTSVLWESYNPSKLWIVVLALGMFATFALFLYDKFIPKDSE